MFPYSSTTKVGILSIMKPYRRYFLIIPGVSPLLTRNPLVYYESNNVTKHQKGSNLRLTVLE